MPNKPSGDSKKFEMESRPALQGELNTNYFVRDRHGYLLLQRIPKDNPEILDSIDREYTSLEFFSNGGSVRRRTPREQASFLEKARARGLKVLFPAAYVDGVLYFPFLENAQTLDKFATLATDRSLSLMISALFTDIQDAHHNGFIYGDRWTKNILVDPVHGILNIDLDLEIGGPAKEFEIAQITYYAMAADKNRIPAILHPQVHKLMYEHRYNKRLFCLFLRNHSRHFAQTAYGDIRREVKEFLESM